MNKTKHNIGLLGSSFNPPHLGHFSVLNHVLSHNIFDKIWLIPVFQHAFNKALISFDHRLEMAQLLCEDLPPDRVDVLSIEKDLNLSPSYTIDVVKALKKQHPSHSFHLIVGSDVKQDLSKWYKINELQQLATFYFVPRQGYEDSPHPLVSSSEIREKIENGDLIEGFTTSKIANYIRKNGLYGE